MSLGGPEDPPAEDVPDYKSASGVLVWLGRYHEDGDGDVQFNHDIWGFDDLEIGSESTTRRHLNLLRN
jgi:hypothetical protein